MPTYQYQCENAHVFDLFETINRRDEVQRCPQCGAKAHRKFASDAPVIYKGNDWTRKEGRDY